MRETPTTRRQADEFAAALERAFGPGAPRTSSTPAADSSGRISTGRSQARAAEMRAFVALVEQLRQVEAPPLRT